MGPLWCLKIQPQCGGGFGRDCGRIGGLSLPMRSRRGIDGFIIFHHTLVSHIPAPMCNDIRDKLSSGHPVKGLLETLCVIHKNEKSQHQTDDATRTSDKSRHEHPAPDLFFIIVNDVSPGVKGKILGAHMVEFHRCCKQFGKSTFISS
jgi:hypothetical protein